MNRVSLVMATIGRVQEIEYFVHSLSSQTHKDYELIIVDQNPDDRLIPVTDFARELGISVKHLRQSEPNQCLARNAGLRQAQGNIVAFPDDDCWYEPDVLEKVLDRMNKSDRPECVVVRWAEQDPVGQLPHLLSNERWRCFREVDASCISLFFTAKLLEKMEGFDPELGFHSWYGGGEETDLMFRVMATGSVVAYLPDAVVHHPANKSFGQPFEKVVAQSQGRARATGALYAKHQLSKYVILRGLLAPSLKALRFPKSPTAIAIGFLVSLWRLQGYLRWSFCRRS